MRRPWSDREYAEALRHPVFIGPQADAPPPTPSTPERQVLPAIDRERQARARRILRFCEKANAFWGKKASVEASDMLIMLDLFAHHLAGRAVAISDACIASLVSNTSALRAIDRLIGAGLVLRRPDSRDSRRKLLVLTEAGYGRVAGYLDAASAVEDRSSDVGRPE